jgi:hypothetical protein
MFREIFKVFSLFLLTFIPADNIINCHRYNNDGVYVSGTISWLAIGNKIEYEWNDIIVDQFVIVSLDLATETYRPLLPLSGFVEVPHVEPFVTELMDCLCFSHRFKETHFVLWKMHGGIWSSRVLDSIPQD